MAVPPPRVARVAIVAFLFSSIIKRRSPDRPPSPEFLFRRTELASALCFTSGQTPRRLSKHVLSSRKAGSPSLTAQFATMFLLELLASNCATYCAVNV